MAKGKNEESAKDFSMDFIQKGYYKIIVVGAGGTGGYFLKEFSRYMSGQTTGKHLTYCIFDGDAVEEHNLERQCFQKEDIGCFKANVLAEILNDAFGSKWVSFPEYITSKEQFLSKIGYDMDIPTFIPIILGCVDNHGCRLILEDVFNSLDSCIYFDSANELESGEVVCSYKFNGKKISKLRTEIFPDVLKGDTRNVTDMSCEELNVSSPQHITVNMFAGLTLLSKVAGFLENEEVFPGFISFNAKLMSSEFYPARCDV